MMNAVAGVSIPNTKPAREATDRMLEACVVRLALEQAQRLGVTLPSATAAAGVLDAARELGYAERDIADLREVLAKTSSEPVR
jgi:3-hydroxyisobutyrate dehydrogenase-like beta-hydroxyacid dehydrogenase